MLQFAQQQATDDQVFLIGRPPLTEFLAFVIGNTVDGNVADRGALAQAWRAANDHVKTLELGEVGLADSPELGELPNHLTDLAADVLGDPSVQRCFALVPVSIQMVELDHLVVYQKAINTNHVERIRSLLGASPTDEEVFHVCFPVGARRIDPPFGAQEGANGWTFVSPSNDLRIVGGSLVEPVSVSDFQPNGSAVAMITIAVGFSVNLLSAAQIEGRLILHNGSHRAYALREAGITHAPCLIQTISRREEIETLGVSELNSTPDVFLTAPRPPLLKDYFDPQLRIVRRVPRKDRHLQVTVSVNPMDLPTSPRD
jgi:hypothetical protein